MSLRLYIHHIEEDRPATIEEIETLFLNCFTDDAGLADLDIRKPNGLAVDSESAFRIEVQA